MHLPANTRIEVRNSLAERLLAPWGRPIIGGFALVTLHNEQLLALSSLKQGRIRLPMRKGELKQLALKVIIPKTAAVGDRYKFQAVQNGQSGHAVGGVELEIHIVA